MRAQKTKRGPHFVPQGKPEAHESKPKRKLNKKEIDALVSELCAAEGGKSSVKAGDMREVISVLNKRNMITLEEKNDKPKRTSGRARKH
jgi:hypothetical protein